MKNTPIFLLLMFIALFTNNVCAEFVFAHINESIMPIDRGEKYEDPLLDFLAEKGIGDVTGGGSLTREGKIEWVGIDIELKDPHKNIKLVAQKLKALGAPAGSFLEYSVGDKQYRVDIK